MIQTKQDTLDSRFARYLLESMADGVFTLNRTGEITSWNVSMEKISGYSAREALGQTCTMLRFNLCLKKSCPSGVKECGIYERGAVDAKECALRHKDGHNVPVLKSARLVKNGHDSVIGIVETVTDLTELKKARRQIEEISRKLGEVHRLDNIIGKSRVMQDVFSAIRAASTSEVTVLIQGESGTGKELVAGAIHYNSDRAGKPLVTVNCSALTESLLESELFGHAKGAFTGAIRDRKGRFEEASGGAVFLDEIGEISPFIQVKLLRVLQEREIERVGESRKRKIDIRVVAATNKDLYQLVRTGEFRQDLYYRLKVFPIDVPPLRHRKEDIPLLASHFITRQNKKTDKQIQGLSQTALRLFMDHSWPGNVRELENAIEHAFVLCNEKEIDIFDLPIELRKAKYQPGLAAPSFEPFHRPRRRNHLSKSHLESLLSECDWNKAEVARRVGLSRTAIWKYMKKWDIPLKQEP
ncbi:MAG: sigma 54-interacting transcriptional regulator [Desulfobacterales bacterium]|nr:sigma 54-interacting transcriptional regulator [Desulfobacterales bacterium]MDX2513264.1 sigma 54-interacting transcriptional regulator [Desulfobacterales bacterium]